MKSKKSRGHPASSSKDTHSQNHEEKKQSEVNVSASETTLPKANLARDNSAMSEKPTSPVSPTREHPKNSSNQSTLGKVIDSENQKDVREITDSVGEKEHLVSTIETLQHENSELLERLQRAQAEFENVCKRLTKEKSDVLQYASMGTIESLLPIIDDFERALETPGMDPQLHQGLEMIGKRICEVFERAGLKEVDVENTKFNPHLHHAVDKASAEKEEQDQEILEVFQKGYLFKDRLLRAALVKVAVKD